MQGRVWTGTQNRGISALFHSYHEGTIRSSPTRWNIHWRRTRGHSNSRVSGGTSLTATACRMRTQTAKYLQLRHNRHQLTKKKSFQFPFIHSYSFPRRFPPKIRNPPLAPQVNCKLFRPPSLHTQSWPSEGYNGSPIWGRGGLAVRILELDTWSRRALMFTPW